MKRTLTFFLLLGTFTTLIAQQSNNYSGTFNGNQYINFQDQASLTPGQFSVEAWVFVSPDAGGSMCIIGKSYAESYYFAIANGNRVRFVPSKWGNGYLDSKPIVMKEKWTHVAATYDGSIAKIYIDGVLDTTKTGMGSVIDTEHDLWVGIDRDGSTPNYGFKGSLDEVRLWNRVLSQTEINENKHLSLSPANDANAYKGLLLNIPFSQGDSFSTADVTVVPNTPLSSDITPTIQPKTAADYLSYNASLKLNGTNGYVAFAHDTAVSVANGHFTIEAWVYHKAAQLGTIYSKHNGAYSKGLTIAVNGSGNLSCKLNGTTTNSNAQLALLRWNHIAVTFDGTNCAYYINGVLDKTFTMPAIEYASDSAFIGKRVLGDAFFNGYIDEVRIVKRARKLSEIKAGMFRSFTYQSAADSGVSFSFEGNTNSLTKGNTLLMGQLMGGAQFSSTAIAGTPVSPVLRALSPDMKVQVDEMPIHKNASVYSGSILVDRNLKIEDVQVFVSMEHTNIAHTRLRLVNPVGDTLVLMENTAPLNNGNLTTVFNANAADMNSARLSFAPAILPQNNLGLFHKRTTPGLWKLEITSPDSMDIGVVHGWGLNVSGKDIVPALYVSDSAKTFAVKGYKAKIDSVVFSGEFLTKEVTLSLEAPFAIQLPGNAGYVQQITLPLTGDSISTRSIVIRYNPTAGLFHQSYFKIQSTEASDSVLLKGVVMLPALMLSKDTIIPFTVSKVNTASAETEFTVEGVFLEDTLHIKSGGPFEVSLTSGSGFDSIVTIPVTKDTLAPVSIFVRYRPMVGTNHADTLQLVCGSLMRKLKLSGKVGAPTGIQELAQSATISYYPNPATNLVTIQSGSTIEEVIITDLNGKVCLHSKETEVNVSELSNGMYLLRIQTVAGVQTLRLAVSH